VTGKPPKPHEKDELEEQSETGGGDDDREKFFSSFDQKKPADNGLLLAAYLYRRYGTAPFTAVEVNDLAKDVGITIPERVDMTLVNAQRKGKALFRRIGKAEFKPTVHGEAYFKETYKVKKGKAVKKQPEATE